MQTTISTTPTAKQSLSLIKNLLGTTIGAIVYLRNLFPEENFKDTNINGLALKSLKRNITKEADELIDWIEKGVFDALEKRYLKTMIFGIFLDPDCPEKLQEGYTFGFSYPSHDQFCITLNQSHKELLSLKNKHEIIRATTDILRRLLVLTQTLSPLPKNAYVTMKLFYYEDETPDDYNPPFFHQGSIEKPFYFNKTPEKIGIGQVETPHHMLNISLQASDYIVKKDEKNEKFLHPIETQDDLCYHDSRIFDSQYNIPTPIPSVKKKSGLMNDTVRENIDVGESCTQDLIAELQIGMKQTEDILPKNDQLEYEIPPSQQDCVISMLQKDGLHATRGRVSEILCPGSLETQQKKYAADSVHQNNVPASVKVECPCMVTQDLSANFYGIRLIQCQDCQKWGHSVCFGYESLEVQDYHSCFDCSPLPNTADTASVNQVALLRLGIAAVLEKGIQSRNWLCSALGLSLAVTNQLISKLQQEGFIVQKEPSSSSRRTKFAFRQVVNDSVFRKRRAIYSNSYFDELFLASTSQSLKPIENSKRKADLGGTMWQDQSPPGPGVFDSFMNQPKKRKVSIARKALVVL